MIDNKAPKISLFGMPPRKMITNIISPVNRVLDMPPLNMPAAIMMTGM